jgi:cell wall-associated NlpC family hydrolase
MRRRDAAAVLTLPALLLAMLLVGGQPAQADPVYPSKDDVRRAQQRVAAVGSQVEQLRRQLDRAASRVEAADVALSSAAEDFDEARIELLNSKRAATAAAEVALRATARLDGAQQQLGRLAAQSYRSGGSVASLDVMLSPSGPDDVLERASMMRTLAGQRQQKVQRMDAARVVATTLDRQADDAMVRQTAAAAKLEQARAAAQQRSVTARATLTVETKARTVLLGRLAATRQTSVEVEQARQTGLAAAAERRLAVQRERALSREAARQRARDRAAAEAKTGNRPPGSSNPTPARPTAVPSTPPDPTPTNPTPSDPTPSDPGPTDPEPGGGSSSGSASAGQDAVAWAKQKLGLPYQWGGAGPGSYDCSGLTMRAWQQAGVQLPHSSRLQYRQVDKIAYSQLRAGDLLFFATNTADPETIHHVAMYVGGGEMIEAPYTGANVRITALRRSGAMPYAGRP